MTSCFADTFYFVAMLNRRDANHERAMALNASLRVRLVTTAWIVTETANAMSKPPDRLLFLQLLERLRTSPSVSIVPFSQSLFEEGLRLYAARSDKGWSLTDCVSFIVMEQEHVKDALTGDHHFVQAGFNALFLS